jgi:cytoskeletal protein CcmA (bactofilin family)
MKKSLGFTLLEMMLVIGLAASATLLKFYSEQAELEQKMAASVGGELAQYNNAVRNYLAKNLGVSNFTRSGSAWLKNTSCGGTLAIGAEYLPCSFPSATVGDPIAFGSVSLTTTVVSTGTAPNTSVTATTLSTPFTLPRSGSPVVRSDLAGLAAITASAGYLPGSPGSGFSATTDGTFQSNPVNGIITMTASNSANQDIWLRTDGGNQMHALLKFDATDPLARQIVGVSRIQNLAAQTLYLGVATGVSPVTAAAVVLDGSAEVIGALRVRSGLSVDGGASVAGDITTSSSIYAGGNVTANGALVAQIFYDANNSGFYVDPNGTSNINTLTATGNINTASSVNANGNVSAAGNVIANGAVMAPIFYDSNNTGYYVNPDATTNINALQANTVSAAGRIRTGEFVEIGGIASAGAGCSPNGLQGRDAQGAALSCVNGLWKKGGSSSFKGSFIVGTFDKTCHEYNPYTGGCFCPSGSQQHLSGQLFRYSQWDETVAICYEVN